MSVTADLAVKLFDSAPATFAEPTCAPIGAPSQGDGARGRAPVRQPRPSLPPPALGAARALGAAAPLRSRGMRPSEQTRCERRREATDAAARASGDLAPEPQTVSAGDARAGTTPPPRAAAFETAAR